MSAFDFSEIDYSQYNYVRRQEKIFHETLGIQYDVQRVFMTASTEDDHVEIGFTFYRRANQWVRELNVETDVYAQLMPFMEVLSSLSTNHQRGDFNNPDKFCEFISDVFHIKELY